LTKKDRVEQGSSNETMMGEPLFSPIPVLKAGNEKGCPAVY